MPPLDPALILTAFFAASCLFALLAITRNLRTISGEPDEEGSLGSTIEAVASDWRALLPHLTELRNRLFYAVAFLAVATAVSAAITPQILEALRRPLPPDAILLGTGLTDQLGTYMRIALTSGFVLALPFIVTQLWIFVAAGLRSNERKYVYWVVPGATILFLMGAAFAFFVMLPAALPFLLSLLPDVEKTVRLNDYVADVTRLLLWVGLAFEMPLIFAVLARIGLVTARQLLSGWRFAVIGIAVVAALITPTADPVNMALAMLPLFGLYLLSVLLAAIVRPRPHQA